MTFQLAVGLQGLRGLSAPTEESRAPAAYCPEIDGLRAVAVGCVVLAHAFPGALPGGFVGVDVFFVISGYLISSILLRELAQGRYSFGEFYARRALRLFPVLIATLVAIAAAGWCFLYEPEFRALGGHLMTSALFGENLRLAGEIGYFDASAAAKPTLHLWSLAIEEQFYLLWPPILAILHRRGSPLAIAFVALAGGSFLAGELLLAAAPASAYYSTLARAWELILGAALAERATRGAAGFERFRDAGAAAGLAFIVVSALLLRPGAPFPGVLALPATLGAALILAAGGRAHVNARALASAPMTALGRISYPLYLWHWPLLSFAHILFGKVSPGLAAGCVALSLALAALSYRFIELPLRRLRFAPAAKALSLAAGMAALALTGAAMRGGVVASRLSAFEAPASTEWDFLKARTPGFRSNGDGVYALAPERREKALLIGDSHLAQYAERLDHVIAADPHRPGAVLAVGGGCAPIEGVTTPDPERAGCAKLEDEAWALARSGGFSTLVVGAAWNWYLRYGDFFIDDGGRPARLSSEAGIRAAMDRLERHFREARAAGLRVVLVLDEPEDAALGPAEWPTRFAVSQQGFPHDGFTEVGANELALHDRLRDWARAQGVEIVDPFTAVCAGAHCRITTASGRPLFRDDNHFNPAWVVDAADFIDVAVAPAR